jgi:acyl transferase domain-containing protein/acyl carrier protein/ubiquinone/menaquinone biosynthesis C-methylase UbiE/ribosomal protein S18 acetylase RimI-like enzyme
MIGVDFNEEALEATKFTLADVPHLVLKGDIADPEDLISDLRRKGISDPENILHIRSFLDHDRPYIVPAHSAKVKSRGVLPYTGVYVDRDGNALSPAEMVQSLVEHFERWATAAGRYGLIIAEVHCLDPEVVASYLDKSESFHFDANHAFSMQHLVEAEVFLMAAAEAGFFPKSGFSKRYPKTFPFSRITIHWFEKRPYIIRHTQPEDLPRLKDLEEQCWTENLRSGMEDIRKRIEVFPQGQCVLVMDGRISAVIYSQRISAANALEKCTVMECPLLHMEDGPVLHLLGISVLPQVQDMGLGDQLLEFMLQWSALKGGIESVTGVTRCKNYSMYAHLSMEEYIGQRDRQGNLVDPILRFHEGHGAVIKRVLPGYRPKDQENGGNGILIEYDIHTRQVVRRKSKVSDAVRKQKRKESTALVEVKECIRSIMGRQGVDEFSLNRPLKEIGLDSLDLMELRSLLSSRFGRDIQSTFFFKYGTPKRIADFFEGKNRKDGESVSENDDWKIDLPLFQQTDSYIPVLEAKPLVPENRDWLVEPIAVIGLSCRFPSGADTPEKYWDLLSNGIDAVTVVPKSRWDNDVYYDVDRDKSGKIVTKYGGFLDNVDLFDASFFRISPREANYTDPQQRILLESAWEALEDAGINPETLAGTQGGVFIGICSHDYELLRIRQSENIDYDTYFATGNSPATAAGRLSYFLDLQGPALSLDTACSSSLVAVHTACQSLRNGDCEIALAGGINLILSPELSIAYSRAGMLSPEGHCKTFDSAADGYVRSEGCGVVVLKKLSRALADKDTILAVIRGSAVNQDGASNGLTAPNGFAQEAVIKKALASAGMDPVEVSYIEAHGTGTPLGDPVEMQALQEVYSQGRTDGQPLIIGSVKTNIGHAEAAAGMAGLIKVILSLRHGAIPPHLHLRELNPNIQQGKIPVVIPGNGRVWEKSVSGGKRRAAVSSFGSSGTNCHVLVEEAPTRNPRMPAEPQVAQLITVSAKNSLALAALAAKYEEYLARKPEVSLADFSYTTTIGRAHFEHRLAIVAESSRHLHKQLNAFAAGREEPGVIRGKVDQRPQLKIAFLFTGQGSQYPGMGRELYRTQPVFRNVLERCDQVLRTVLEVPLLSVLFSETAPASLLHQTAYTQPALFALEYALAQLWRSWGVEPDVVMGHSVGEYVAACVAGVFGLEEGLKLIAERGRLMQSLPRNGRMAVVFAEEGLVRQAIQPYRRNVSIAALNGPGNIVISGAAQEIGAAVGYLENEGLTVIPLQVSHAFHSPLMEPILSEFAEVAGSVAFSPPIITMISNLTGRRIDDEVCHSAYWCDHIRRPVNFEGGMKTLFHAGCDVFLEVGPKPVLNGMGAQCLAGAGDIPHGYHPIWLAGMKEDTPASSQMMKSLGQLYVLGHPVRFAGLWRNQDCRRLGLPVYPWQRQRYWLPEPVVRQKEGIRLDRIDHSHESSLDDWLYELKWQVENPDDNINATGLRQWCEFPEYMPSPLRLTTNVLAGFKQYPGQEVVEKYTALSPFLERLSAGYVIEALNRLGWHPPEGETVLPDELAERLGVVAQHHRLFGRMLEILQQEGALRRVEDVGDHRQVAAELVAEDPEKQVAALRQAFPDFEEELSLLHRCGNGLHRVLTGEWDPIQLLFPDGSATRAEKFYQDSPFMGLWNHLVRETLAEALRDLPEGRKVRIVEIGAGTGATTMSIVPGLPPDRTEYVFTDISQFFLNEAKRKFQDFPFMTYRLLDIEKDVERQEFSANRYDLVVAANVLHATSDLEKTVNHAKQLLAPHGLLVLLEVTRQVRWLDLVFGLTEGWWKFSDFGLRPSHPLLSQQKWRHLLDQRGFSQIGTIPGPGEGIGAFPQAIIVARNSGPHRNGKEQAEVSAAPSGAGTWLVFADKGGIGRKLAELTASSGGSDVLVFPGEAYSAPRNGVAYVNPGRYRDFKQLLLDMTGKSPLQGVVHLWSLDMTEAEKTTLSTLERDSRYGCGSALYAAQALADDKEGGAALWLVTRGGQPVGKGEESLEIGQAPLWGLGRGFSLEHPENWGGLVDLDPRADSDISAALLYRELHLGDSEDQIAFRGGNRYVARLARCGKGSRSRQTLRFEKNGTYLISGGLGGLGLKVARWLAGKGAGHITLIGRRGLEGNTLRKRQAVKAIEEAGAAVHILSADVSDASQMALLIENIVKAGPPLKGVFHAAGVVDLIPFRHIDSKSLQAAFRAKVTGTWLIHELTKDMDLDLFVLFSSGASLWGSKDLAHYGAANQFLDAMAHFRRARGLPALAINWGWWPGGGATKEAEADYKRMGLHPMTDEGCLKALEEHMASGAVQQAVSNFDWKVFGPVMEAKRQRPFLKKVVVAEESAAPGSMRERVDFSHRLQTLSAGEGWELLKAVIRREAAQVIGYNSPDLLDPKQGFFSLGMDSIMSLQFKKRMEESLGRKLPQTLAFEYPNVEALTAYLGREVLALEEPVKLRAVRLEDHEERGQKGMDDRETLSEDDLVELLAQRLYKN